MAKDDPVLDEGDLAAIEYRAKCFPQHTVFECHSPIELVRLARLGLEFEEIKKIPIQFTRQNIEEVFDEMQLRKLGIWAKNHEMPTLHLVAKNDQYDRYYDKEAEYALSLLPKDEK